MIVASSLSFPSRISFVKNVIEGLKRISKPGLRKYVGATEIPRVLGGLGVSIVSTSEGVMTGTQAKGKNLGGELLCYIW
jgi:small subunit ribosomal protein S8